MAEAKETVKKPHKPHRKVWRELTETKLKGMKQKKPPEKDEDTYDGDGLFIRRTTRGKLIWKLNYSVNRKYINENKNGEKVPKRSVVTLGRYPDMSLKEARIKANELKEIARKGKKPYIQEEEENKEAKKDLTFKEVAELWYEEKIKLSSIIEKSKHTIKARIERHLYPILGDKIYKNITFDMLYKVIKDKYKSQGDNPSDITKRLISDLSRIGIWAKKRGHNDKNIAEELYEECSEMKPKTRNYPAITDPKKLGEYLNKLETFDIKGLEVVKDAMIIIAYIPVRKTELCEAKVNEIDIENNIWTIPKERMKNRKDFIVPLPNNIAKIFKKYINMNGDKTSDCYIFQTNKGHISENTMGYRLTLMGYSKEEVTIHGFRSTFSTLMRRADLSWNTEEIIEKNLAHTYGSNVSRHYNRGGYIERRRKCYEDYAYILDGLKAGKDFNELVKELKRKHFEEDMNSPLNLNTTKS